MNDSHETHVAWIKMAWAWAFVGVSQMTPLQALQGIAAIAATAYSVVQTYLLIRDRILRKRVERDTKRSDL